jgi:hypothetical protein
MQSNVRFLEYPIEVWQQYPTELPGVEHEKIFGQRISS